MPGKNNNATRTTRAKINNPNKGFLKSDITHGHSKQKFTTPSFEQNLINLSCCNYFISINEYLTCVDKARAAKMARARIDLNMVY